MTKLIEVGDEIKNHQNVSTTIDSIEIGIYGLLINGHRSSDGYSFEVYAPYELVVDGRTRDWNGWGAKSSVTLANGRQVAVVADVRDLPTVLNLEDYETKWKQTIPLVNEGFNKPAEQKVY